jgi:hypothetical protein
VCGWFLYYRGSQEVAIRRFGKSEDFPEFVAKTKMTKFVANQNRVTFGLLDYWYPKSEKKSEVFVGRK